MKKSGKTEWAIWVFSALPLAATLALLPALPAQVPLHWNLAGEVDRYGAPLETLGTAALSLALCALLKWAPRLDPKKENYARFAGGYNAFRLALSLFFCLMTGITLYAAFAPAPMDVSLPITAAVGILLCVIGNFMPKFKHNYFCGIKSPWTLADENVWRRTHRMAGPIWFWSGLGVLAGSFFLRKSALMALVLGAMLLEVAVPYVYSYFAYKSETKH